MVRSERLPHGSPPRSPAQIEAASIGSLVNPSGLGDEQDACDWASNTNPRTGSVMVLEFICAAALAASSRAHSTIFQRTGALLFPVRKLLLFGLNWLCIVLRQGMCGLGLLQYDTCKYAARAA